MWVNNHYLVISSVNDYQGWGPVVHLTVIPRAQASPSTVQRALSEIVGSEHLCIEVIEDKVNKARHFWALPEGAVLAFFQRMTKRDRPKNPGLMAGIFVNKPDPFAMLRVSEVPGLMAWIKSSLGRDLTQGSLDVVGLIDADQAEEKRRDIEAEQQEEMRAAERKERRQRIASLLRHPHLLPMMVTLLKSKCGVGVDFRGDDLAETLFEHALIGHIQWLEQPRVSVSHMANALLKTEDEVVEMLETKVIKGLKDDDRWVVAKEDFDSYLKTLQE